MPLLLPAVRNDPNGLDNALDQSRPRARGFRTSQLPWISKLKSRNPCNNTHLLELQPSFYRWLFSLRAAAVDRRNPLQCLEHHVTGLSGPSESRNPRGHLTQGHGASENANDGRENFTLDPIIGRRRMRRRKKRRYDVIGKRSVYVPTSLGESPMQDQSSLLHRSLTNIILLTAAATSSRALNHPHNNRRGSNNDQ